MNPREIELRNLLEMVKNELADAEVQRGTSWDECCRVMVAD